ncbi:hypothetical protein [Streptomyces katsurahamanus]|uniref:Tat pathway signal sequence domain protein n=1 Tax=Streptomyces katsurahamanus TaxID=2577098 RepID=A0ABW9NRB6_9ACTN|nr:hypothetical protein [Streptomyces katsurahamanus]MQS35599.1 hypothetical protein [Streptomyces katsurahamanus]
MKRSTFRRTLHGGRIAVLTAATAVTLVLPLPLGTAAGAASLPPPAAAPAPVSPPVAAKPEGPIESSLSVAATGALAALGTVVIVRRHHRRGRDRRRDRR